ncbi:MAG: lysozyme [Gemmatimonadaceae bacterium]
MTIAVTNGLATASRLFVAATVAAALACEREPQPRTTANFSPPPGVATPAPRDRKRMSAEGLARIREHEAFVPKVYDDGAGNSTIGYGHMVLEGEDFSGGISEAEAIALFEKDVERVVNGALDKIRVDLTQNQVDALGSFIFNVGPGAFVKGLLPHINARKHERAASRILKYITGRDARTGERRVLRGLRKRREAEVALFRNPRPLKYLPRAVKRSAARILPWSA